MYTQEYLEKLAVLPEFSKNTAFSDGMHFFILRRRDAGDLILIADESLERPTNKDWKKYFDNTGKSHFDVENKDDYFVVQNMLDPTNSSVMSSNEIKSMLLKTRYMSKADLVTYCWMIDPSKDEGRSLSFNSLISKCRHS